MCPTSNQKKIVFHPHSTRRFISAFIFSSFCSVALYFTLCPVFDNGLDIVSVAPGFLGGVCFTTAFGVGVLVSPLLSTLLFISFLLQNSHPHFLHLCQFCLQIPDITDSVSFSLGVSVAIARSFDIGYNHIQFVSLSAILTSICCALVLVEYDSSAVVAVKLFLHRLVVLMFRSACLVFVLQPHVNERKEILIFWLGFGSLSLLGFVQGDPLCGRDSVSGNDNSIKSSGRLSAGVIKQQHPKLVEVSFFSFSDRTLSTSPPHSLTHSTPLHSTPLHSTPLHSTLETIFSGL